MWTGYCQAFSMLASCLQTPVALPSCLCQLYSSKTPAELLYSFAQYHGLWWRFVEGKIFTETLAKALSGHKAGPKSILLNRESIYVIVLAAENLIKELSP